MLQYSVWLLFREPQTGCKVPSYPFIYGQRGDALGYFQVAHD